MFLCAGIFFSVHLGWKCVMWNCLKWMDAGVKWLCLLQLRIRRRFICSRDIKILSRTYRNLMIFKSSQKFKAQKLFLRFGVWMRSLGKFCLLIFFSNFGPRKFWSLDFIGNFGPWPLVVGILGLWKLWPLAISVVGNLGQ